MLLNIKQNKTVRNKNYIRIINKYIQSYIKNPIGNLDLNYVPINKLPSNLKYVDSSFHISYTKISELPKGLIIDGLLFINNTFISELPEDITIRGNLYCYNTPLGEKYTVQELRKKYNIKGNIIGDYN